ncbi:hypothetical protein LXL04_005045 [Taraxacum kok-saghyz]
MKCRQKYMETRENGTKRGHANPLYTVPILSDVPEETNNNKIKQMYGEEIYVALQTHINGVTSSVNGDTVSNNSKPSNVDVGEKQVQDLSKALEESQKTAKQLSEELNEKQKKETSFEEETTGMRRKEGSYRNKSLLTLGTSSQQLKHINCWYTERHSSEFPVQGGGGGGRKLCWINTYLCGSGAARNDVEGSDYSTSLVLHGWPINGLLGGCDGVESCHESLNNAKYVADFVKLDKYLSQRSKAVGCATGV